MIISNLLLVGKFLLLEFVFTLISWPITSIFFCKLSDRGFSAAKIFGWIVTAYLLFVFSTLKIISFQNYLVVFVVWTVLNLIVEIKQKTIRLNLFNVRVWVWPQLLFTVIFLFWAWIRAHQPEIYQIERFMDYGIMQSLLNADHLPVFDFWSAGNTLNYYYFGHIIGTTILRFTQTPLLPGFFVLIAWGIAVLGVNVYRLAHDLSGSIRAALLSTFAVCFAGTAYSLWWIKTGGAGWYAEPTRAIVGTIMEMPVYSFLVADNHAHVWGLIIAVIFLLNLFLLWRKPETKNILLAFFLLGISFITNTWDFAFLSIPLFLVLFFKRRIFFLLSYFLSGLVVLPWVLFYKPPVSGLGIVPKQSDPLLWLVHWGFFLIAPLLIIKTIKHNGFLFLIFFSALTVLGFVEIFYLKDILKDGEWFRANTTFKATIQVWLWLGIIFGPAWIKILSSIDNKYIRLIPAFVLSGILFVQVYYPYKAIGQSNLENKTMVGLERGLDWWKQKYPDDFAGYEFLKNISGQHVVLEAEGESYTDTSRFSTFLGWPTVAGWAVHEWTWNGAYDPIGARGMEVREVYLGSDIAKTQAIMQKYKVEYIILGQVERDRYKTELKEEKVLGLGKIIFQTGWTRVIKVPGHGFEPR